MISMQEMTDRAHQNFMKKHVEQPTPVLLPIQKPLPNGKPHKILTANQAYWMNPDELRELKANFNLELV